MIYQGDCLTVLRERFADESVPAEILAYCAGVIDSDGTIGVKRNTYKVRVIKDSGQPSYSERVCVKQVEREAVDLLKSTFGGYQFVERPSVKNGKPLYGWQVTDIKATRCLVLILPFLRIKKRQAENCLCLRCLKEQSKKARLAVGRGHIGSAVRPAFLSESMESCYRYAHTLNVVGRSRE